MRHPPPSAAHSICPNYNRCNKYLEFTLKLDAYEERDRKKNAVIAAQADVTDILFPKKPAAGVGCLAERESAGVSRVRPIRTSTAV